MKRATRHALPLLLALWSSALTACSSSTPATRAEEPLRHPYMMCYRYAESGADRSPAIVRADAQFDQAQVESSEGRFAAAAERYVQAAQNFREAVDGKQSLRNRHIAYANAVNCWLNVGQQERAQSALAAAQLEDLELSPVLRAWAQRLPHPARCSAP